jgi:hypothetical protein
VVVFLAVILDLAATPSLSTGEETENAAFASEPRRAENPVASEVFSGS